MKERERISGHAGGGNGNYESRKVKNTDKIKDIGKQAIKGQSAGREM